jgi:hypothetical protein
VAGPLLVNYIRQYRIDHGVPPADSYDVTMYLMAGLLVLGFIANLAVRPVPERYHISEADLARERGLAPAGSAGH